MFKKCENATICLGIESTAHTFGVGVASRNERESLGSYRIISDSKDVYKAPAGSGIHPREASRHHVEVAATVVGDALSKARLKISDVDLIAYAAGPGLGPCLRVGAVVARSLASYYDKPIVPSNHAIGHIELGKLLCNQNDPLVLVVSGGHTALAAMVKRHWKIFGETLDLTLGQLIDQLGRFIDLSSPSGPQIEQLAALGRGPRSNEALLSLPYTIKGNDVSYSGLLSAAKDLFRTRTISKETLCFAVQEIAFSVLAEATERALAFTEKDELLVTGGVAANQRLAEVLGKMSSARNVRIGVIPRQYAGDCGSQIAIAGFKFYDRNGGARVRDAFIRQSWRIDQVSI